MNDKKIYFILIQLFLISIFFAPNIVISGHFPKIRPEEIIIVLLIFYLLKTKIYLNNEIKVYLFLLLLFEIWLIISLLLNINLQSFNGIYEILKIIKFIIILCTSYYYTKTNKNPLKVINIIFFFLFIFNIFQYYDIFNFNYYMKPFFYSLNPFHYEYNLIALKVKGNVRLLGTLSNPNQNSIVLSFFVIYYLIIAVKDKRLINYIFLFLSFYLLLLTNSRTNFLAIFFSISIYTVFINKNIKYKVFFIIAVFLVTMFILKINQFKYLSTLILRPITENSSLLKRLEVWDFLIEMIKEEKLLIGYGPYKDFFYQRNIVAESEYILMFWRYGFIGLILHFFILSFPLIVVIKNLKNSEFSQISLLFVIIIIITSITMAPISQPRIGALFAFIVGIGFGHVDAKENIKTNNTFQC